MCPDMPVIGIGAGLRAEVVGNKVGVGRWEVDGNNTSGMITGSMAPPPPPPSYPSRDPHTTSLPGLV